MIPSDFHVEGTTIFRPGAERTHIAVCRDTAQAQHICRCLNLLLTMRDMDGVFTMANLWRTTIDSVLAPMPATNNAASRDQLSTDPNWFTKFKAVT